MQRRELDASLWRDLEALVRFEAEDDAQLVPKRFEVSFGTERSPQELQRGLDLGEGLTLSGKIDRIDVDPFSTRGIVQDYKAGRNAPSAIQIEKELRLQIPLYMLVLRDLVGIEPLGGVYRPLAGDRKPRGLLRAEAQNDVLAGYTKSDYLDDGRVLGPGRERADERALARAAHPHRRRAPRSARRRLPAVVRPLADVPGEARVSSLAPNPEQRAAIDARGRVFLSAGAGTGKTAVLVERFVEAVCDRGIDVGSILVITYTRKAAGELRTRIRRELRERGRHDLARELDGAWIGTIHGFCARLLRAYPFEAGLDPRFRELDEAQSAVLAGEAFELTLDEFCAGDRPERLRLLATYGTQRLRRMLIGVYETLRSAGRPLELDLGERAPLADRLDQLRDAARCLADDANATDLQQQNSARLLELVQGDPSPDRLLDLSAHKASGLRAQTYEDARKAVEQAATDEVALRDRDLLQELLEGFARAYAEAKRREGVLDFEDLQLGARDLLLRNERIRSREHLRFAAIMVDEFQDTNRLQCELIDLIADGPGKPEVFFVGDEFQSIYGFRHADVRVFRERREAEGGGIALVAELPLTAGGARRGQLPLPRRVRRGLPAARRVGRVPRSRLRPPGGAARHREGDVRRHRRALAPRRGEAHRAAGARARRRGRGHTGRDRPALRGGHRRRVRTSRSCGTPDFRRTARPAADTSASSRSSTSSVPAPAAQPLRRPGARHGARVAVRRRLERRARAHPQGRVEAADVLRDREGAAAGPAGARRAPSPRVPAAVRAARARACRGCRSSGSASGSSPSTTTTSPCSLSGTAAAATRTCASSRGSRARTRSCAVPTIEGFVRFVREQEAVGAKELEAVAEEEGADAVRLLTIHAAKGLEFKVVVVADAGRDSARARRRRDPRALRRALRVPRRRPGDGERRGAFDYEAVRARDARRRSAERLRLYYVAMTRAIDRLIVSGAVDREKAADRATPIGWVLARLDAADELAAADGAPVELERGARGSWSGSTAAAPEAADEPPRAGASQGQLSSSTGPRRTPLPPPAPTLPQLVAVPEPPLHQVRRLSFTALSLFEQLLVPVLRRARRRDAPRDGAAPSDDEGLSARRRSAAPCTSCSSTSTSRRRGCPTARRARTRRLPGRDRRRASRASARRSRRTARRSSRHASPGSTASRRSGTSRSSTTACCSTGFLDVLHRRRRPGARRRLQDERRSSERRRRRSSSEEYRLQRLVYALACFRAGADEVEVVYQFLEQPDEPVVTAFTRDDVAALEAELSEAIARIHAGEFRPTPSEFACAGCPALDVVCAGPRLPTQPARRAGGRRA